MKQLSPANRAVNMGVSEGLAADPVLRGRAVAEGVLGEHLHAHVCVCALSKFCPLGKLWGQSLNLLSVFSDRLVRVSVRPIWP